jgi:carboxymethylenebutenolidase
MIRSALAFVSRLTVTFLCALAAAARAAEPAPAPPAAPAPEAAHAERMAREHAHDTATPSPATVPEPRQSVVGAEVVYGKLDDGTALRGYVAHPAEGHEGLPGLLVVHEWWGLNDEVRAMTRRLAGEGYLALAVDLYEGQVATDREAARAAMTATLDRPARLLANLRAAARDLREDGKAPKLGVVGWCFGGGWALRAAVDLADTIDAAVVYYGRTTADPQELAKLRAPLLGLFGALDRGIPLEGVRAMEAELAKLGKRATIVVYPDADHAFANPTGTRYQAAAAEDAWRRTFEFFAAHLGRR